MELHFKNISKNYKGKEALHIDELLVREGSIFGLVGNNGAGKTTLFRIALDLIKPDTGEVWSGDLKVHESDIWKEYTGAYLDQSFLLDFMKPEEYFYFLGHSYGLRKKEVDHRIESLSAFFGGEVLRQKGKYIRDLSSGNKQKVGIAGVFLIGPRVIILDEPFNALDPSSQITLKNLIRDYHNSHQAITLVSSHDLNHITDISSRIAIMEKGRIVKDLGENSNMREELNEYFMGRRESDHG